MLRVQSVTANGGAGSLTAVKVADRNTPTVAAVKSDLSDASSWQPDEPLAAAKIIALFAAARRLRTDSNARAHGNALRGKNLVLLLARPTGREVSPLQLAALDLGARVAEIPFDTDASSQLDIGTLARLLGRMYDAIDCDTLPMATVRMVEREAGVPVYAGLGLDGHPARMIADLLTVAEHGRARNMKTGITFIGDPCTPRASIFLMAARELGFAPQIAEAEHVASNDAPCVVDATHPSTWSLYAEGRPIEEASQSANHRYAIQTVLLDTIPRG